jgi:hypothetical protein
LDVFKAKVNNCGSVQEMNQVYWEDMARAVEAYSVMSLWSATELVESICLHSQKDHYNSMAILARSLIELAAYYRYVASYVIGTVKRPPDSFSEKVILCAELERIVYRAIWGTRLSMESADDKQINILTIISKLAEWTGGTRLKEVYEHLCEVAHPNVLGNARFWYTDESQWDGAHLVRMRRRSYGPGAGAISERTLWALGWSSNSIGSSFVGIRDCLKNLSDFLAKGRGNELPPA